MVWVRRGERLSAVAEVVANTQTQRLRSLHVQVFASVALLLAACAGPTPRLPIDGVQVDGNTLWVSNPGETFAACAIVINNNWTLWDQVLQTGISTFRLIDFTDGSGRRFAPAFYVIADINFHCSRPMGDAYFDA